MITDTEAITSAQKTPGPKVQQGYTMAEENRTLKQQMPKICQAEASGRRQTCHESQFATQQEQYHSPEYQSYLFDLPANTEKLVRKRSREEIALRMKNVERRLKDMQGLAGQKSVAFKDLCIFPDVRLPPDFKTPKFEKYDGHGNPIAHLKRYCNKMRNVGENERLLMACFGESLTGAASDWFVDHDTSGWFVWDDMAQAFVKQFQYNIDIAPDRTYLSNLKKKSTESFKEYAIKWREQAARVKPPMDDHELITVFLQAQEPDYFQHMMSAIGGSFSKAIKIGEMVENGLKTGKIISQAILKATNQVESDRDGKDKEVMMSSGSRRAPRRKFRGYEQPHRVFHDSPEQYYPSPNPQYSVNVPQYMGQSPKHSKKRSRASRSLRQPSQNFQMPYNPHPNQGYRRGQKLKDDFAPIGESYASLFERLKQDDMIAPIPPNHVDRRARTFDSSKRCEYHSNAQGHSIESCRDLKREIERMIQENMIEIQGSDKQSIMPNSLLAHDDACVVGMMTDDIEYENPLVNLSTEVGEGHHSHC